VWAPLTATWDVENRTTSVRVINGPGKSAARLELRQTAADINPYTAIAAALASGLHGVEHAIKPPPATRGDASAASEAPALPTTLAAATELLRRSERARQVLPEAFIDHYVRTRDWEVRQHAKAVSQWELERYFESI